MGSASVPLVGAADQMIEWDDEAFEHALKQAAEGIIEARDVRLSAQQLDRLLYTSDPRFASCDPRHRAYFPPEAPGETCGSETQAQSLEEKLSDSRPV